MSGTSGINILVRMPDLSGPGGYSNPADIRIVGFNTRTCVWDNLSGATGASSNVAGTMMRATVPNMADYSALGIGSVSTAGPLPVGLLAFSGRAAGCQTELEWELSRSASAASFTVHRSDDGQRWSGIGEVPAQRGQDRYRFTDREPAAPTSFYRLQLTEAGGRQSYSSVLAVRSDCGEAPGITIAPVPFNDRLRIGGMAAGTTIRIFTADGRTVWTGTADASIEIATRAWLPGQYMALVVRGVKEVTVRSVVKG